MTARILSGKPIAEMIRAEVAAEVIELGTKLGIRPCLAAVRVGADPASEIYVGNKVKAAAEVGIVSEHHHLSAATTEDELLSLVCELNGRDDVDGILVQLPLPAHIDEKKVIGTLDPAKDVDGFHPMNVGKLSLGVASLVPCTPAGVIEILKRSMIEIEGRHAVVVGRSNIVGKPLAMLLLRENATVTICHSRTADLPSIARKADLLIAAVGRPGFIRSEHIGEDATVVDVGINRVTDAMLVREIFDGDELEKRLGVLAARGATIVGDVAAKDAMAKAGNYTPVPGGVGLLTVAMLMKNTVDAARRRRNTL
jgi:methylenetetrahydrofolate dehydrogenase (NADP+)/methenyltetrahydrofolate cyclohydrolase